jgi:hypothetical protein
MVQFHRLSTQVMAFYNFLRGLSSPMLDLYRRVAMLGAILSGNRRQSVLFLLESRHFSYVRAESVARFAACLRRAYCLHITNLGDLINPAEPCFMGDVIET